MKHAKQVQDPVCGVMVDIDQHAVRTTHDGADYYFCCTTCRNSFMANPVQFLGAAVEARPVHAQWGGLVTPKFGSAGSGGAEYERGSP